MKKSVRIAAVFLLIGSAALGQSPGSTDTTITLDLLRAPSSPAVNLLGIAPSDIEKPSDLSAFRLSLNQATNNFTQLPKSYAVEFNPWLLFSDSNRTIDRLRKNDFVNNFKQSFTLSAGIRNLDAGEEDSLSPAKTKVAFGFKFSIARGTLVDDKLLDTIIGMQKLALKEIQVGIDSLISSDPAYKSAVAKFHSFHDAGLNDSAEFYQKAAASRHEVLNLQILDLNQTLPLLKSKAAGFQMRRTGFKADVAGGLALDFLEERFSDSRVAKAGAWATAGYEGRTGWAFLALGRYLFQPDKIFADKSGTVSSANIHTLDGGARLIYSAPQSRFSLSSELIYRSVLNKSAVPSSWRFTVNADYDIGQNRKLTFAFGRDFDGTVSRTGNLIAALNLLVGFGNSKKLQ